MPDLVDQRVVAVQARLMLEAVGVAQPVISRVQLDIPGDVEQRRAGGIEARA